MMKPMKANTLAIGLGSCIALVVATGLSTNDWRWMISILLMTTTLWIAAYFISRKEKD